MRQQIQTTIASWHWVTTPVSIFFTTRLGVVLVAYLAVTLFPHESNPAPYHLRGTGNVLLDVFGSRWDTGFYVSIVEEGYRYRGVPLPSVAFFPLLPLGMRVLLPVFGDAVVAGIVLANVALLGATILLYRLVSEMWDTGTATRAVWYLLIFPTAFYGSAIYTESLLLLTAIGALYLARREQWYLAGVLAFAAGLTRLVGIIVTPMLLLEWLRQRRSDTQVPLVGFPLACTAPMGTLAYMFYLSRTFGDPLALFRASAAWERVPQSPGITIARLLKVPEEGWRSAFLAGNLPLNDWFDLGMILLFLFLSFVLLYQHRWSEGIFVWLGVMMSFSSGLLMSQRRYVWVLFPAFILLAQWGERPWVDRLLTTLFLLGLALFTALFANGFWVA